jgi:peptidyl-prolyl cis-trans isomerase C
MSQMEEIASAQGVSMEDFLKTMAQHGRSLEQMKDDLRERLARSQFMATQWAGKINVTEEDARKYHQDNPEQFKLPEQVRVSHILIKPELGEDPNEARARIEGLLEQIKEGADFAELAKANSVCPSAPKGGDLGFFPRGKTTPAFEEVAFELQVGQLSDVVETEYGFHIIKATDHQDPTNVTFTQAKEKIIEKLTEEKQSEFADEYLKKLKAEAKIVYPTST